MSPAPARLPLPASLLPASREPPTREPQARLPASPPGSQRTRGAQAKRAGQRAGCGRADWVQTADCACRARTHAPARAGTIRWARTCDGRRIRLWAACRSGDSGPDLAEALPGKVSRRCLERWHTTSPEPGALSTRTDLELAANAEGMDRPHARPHPTRARPRARRGRDARPGRWGAGWTQTCGRPNRACRTQASNRSAGWAPSGEGVRQRRQATALGAVKWPGSRGRLSPKRSAPLRSRRSGGRRARTLRCGRWGAPATGPGRRLLARGPGGRRGTSRPRRP